MKSKVHVKVLLFEQFRSPASFNSPVKTSIPVYLSIDRKPPVVIQIICRMPMEDHAVVFYSWMIFWTSYVGFLYLIKLRYVFYSRKTFPLSKKIITSPSIDDLLLLEDFLKVYYTLQIFRKISTVRRPVCNSSLQGVSSVVFCIFRQVFYIQYKSF